MHKGVKIAAGIVGASVLTAAVYKYTTSKDDTPTRTRKRRVRKAIPYMVGKDLHLRSPGVSPKQRFIASPIPGKRTVTELLEHVCKKYNDKVVYTLRHIVKIFTETNLQTGEVVETKQYGSNQNVTYKQFFMMVRNLARGVRMYVPQKNEVGIYLDTSLDWIMSLHAVNMNRMTLVTMGQNEVKQIINEAELEVIITHHSKIKFFEKIQKLCPTLKKIIVVGKLVPSKLYQMKSITDLIVDGSKIKGFHFRYPKPRDLAVIMYTSGTTGKPKGVMLTHQNLVASCAGIMAGMRTPDIPYTEHVYLSYLPMAHIFELCVHMLYFTGGSKIGFASPRTLFAKPGGAKIIGDLANIKPTVIPGVPRVWETLRKAVLAKVRAAGGLKKKLFDSVLAKKINNLKKGINEKVALEDIVFKAVREMFGGNLKVLISGGAALGEECNYFLSSALGVDTDYGLTETAAATCVQWARFGWQGVGDCGQILECTEVKLIDVPDMNYSVKSDPPQGEICVQSKSVSVGYYKSPKLTEEVFKDGWFHTGDIGEVSKIGTIKIIDRKKNLVKLTNGEYIAVEHLECLFGNSSFVQPNGIAVFVVTHRNIDTICGIVLADIAYAMEWARVNNIAELDIKKIVAMKKYKDAMMKDFEDIHEKNKLAKYAKLNDVRVFLDKWGVADDTTTPSFKLKRRVIKKKYEKHINQMCGISKSSGGNKGDATKKAPKSELEKILESVQHF